MSHVVVIGAGQAGAALVAKLRGEGFEGRITLVGAETAPPYQRPPLSKAYLLGEMARERLFLRPESWYAEHDVALRLGARAEAIDPAARRVTLQDGETLDYDALALCTGAHPRRLPAAIGGDLPGVLTMRDLADADRLSPEMVEGRRLLVVGGGYIGLEAAAVARKRGLEVILVETAERILGRVAAPETSAYFRDLHARHGVEIREGCGLERLLGEDRVTGARLTDGTEIAVDFAIAGVGVEPATGLAEAAGLALENGIRCDRHCRTSDERIWAAGDCASLLWGDARVRLESVGNAIDMAEAAALNIMGRDVEYRPRPWFWSDQYDVKLQIAGLNAGWDAVHVRPGATPEQCSHWYYRGATLIAVDAMNDSRAYMVGKRLIEAGKSPDPAQVADPSVELKALLK
ncbi:NAD(P)/FAD-dependent oxidoreductase [Limimaricola pyoseonensis]|uniref:3-phenylpropionate/trans-cinnamate dioxygenase ferredoxin reductase subunit n=1 Tax=Limimaricola pyoseonensis TaxID=521013 RepID=A0A1G7F2P7_9RHOB|nr:FAD-dependent oxidoreductase [Limimaricola pyoseonensis]SDE70280.1 3-phenylpropionate/trans-cinnamate dioxygenase ferredoxin reductase subunit [Limimaricola pyoseonensis]